MASIALGSGALFLWIDYLLPSRGMPLFSTLLALIAVAATVFRFKKEFPKIHQLRQGRMGEQFIAQYLEEELRPKGWQIVNDVPADGFNLDHVLIGPSGIFTIETKTISKHLKGSPKIVYDGQSLTINGHKPDRDPIQQALGQSRWLTDLIKQSTGQQFKVKPVVLYPKWFVQSLSRNPAVLVQNESYFVKYLSSQPITTSEADIHLITYHLKRYVISKTKEEKA
jgi:hypothetical protein